MKPGLYTLFALSLLLSACSGESSFTPLSPGMVISSNAVLAPDTLKMPADWNPQEPLIRIEGSDLAVDFNGAVLIGKGDPTQPDQFAGTAIYVAPGREISLLQPRAHGFKIGLRADSCLALELRDADFSYNYRQHLKSTREAEDLDDWLSYHQNENDEWLRYGAAVYLNDCDSSLVIGLRVTGGQNGLMLTGCDHGLFYNNDIRFNSGIGIGLYRSSGNRVMHNRLDWNVRGYSHGIYARGQDSAGILCYEQSNENVFAYNSATHSGDGFFLWAGQTTMDTGEGGCNDNLIYGNDFSHAPTNGIEVTFSRNVIVKNRLTDCKYGIWGGYSYQTKVIGNLIENNRFGLAIEHGQANMIRNNVFAGNEIALQLWERDSQPADWGYARQREVDSRNYYVEDNMFLGGELVFDIRQTEGLHVNQNSIWNFEQLANPGFWVANPEFKANQLSDPENVPTGLLSVNSILTTEPDSAGWMGGIPNPAGVAPLSDGQVTYLPDDALRGRSYILVDEWGPYDFRSPSFWLRRVADGTYTFLLLGPPTGNWRAVDGTGWTSINPKTGTFPATLTARVAPGADSLRLDLEYIGEAFTDRFGQTVKRGKVVEFGYKPVNGER